MNRKHTSIVLIVATVLIGCAAFAFRLPAEAGEPSPAAAVQATLDAVRNAKSHRFSAEVHQHVRPINVPTAGDIPGLTIQLDGEVAEPGHARLHWSLSDDTSGLPTDTEVLLIGDEAYIKNDGSWRKVAYPLGVAAPAADAVSLLDAVTDVQRLPDVESAAGVSRHYSFAIDSDRYATMMRTRLETLLTQDTGYDVSIRSDASQRYWNVGGAGELWVGEDGLPQRVTFDLALPEVTSGFDASLQMQVDFRDFGEPIAPVEAPGLDGTGGPAQATTISEGALAAALPQQLVLPVILAALLLALAALAAVVIRRRAGYVVVAVGMTVVFVFGPLLQTGAAASSLDRLAAQQEPPLPVDQAAGLSALDPAQLQAAAARLAQPDAVTADVSDCSIIPGGLPATDDQDQDGMDNLTESCLGTDYNHADSDGDTITDTLELQGFTLNNTTWTTNPKMRDSNLDGMDDVAEWNPNWTTQDASTLDPDGDGIPNPWDDDNDGDGIVDSLDNSPFTVLPYKSSYELKITKPTSTLHQNTYVYVDLLVQPQDASHLRYNTTPLDWPSDDKGQIQDLNNSADDVTLFPMVQFNTTTPPSLTTEYGYLVSGPDGSGVYQVMAPLTAVGANGAIDAFRAHMGFTANETALGMDLTNVKVGWLAQTKTDQQTTKAVFHRIYGNFGYWTNETSITTTDEVAASYYESSIRVAGLSVTESEDVEVALLGAPNAPETSTTTDDEGTVMSNLMAGLNSSYLYNVQPDLPTIVNRFSSASTPASETWGITPPLATTYNTYAHREQALATTTMTTTVDFLSANYSHSRTPMVALGYQETTGALGLESGSVSTSGSKITVDLSGNTLSTMRQIEITQYQWQSGSQSWTALSMDQALAELANRYPNQEQQSTKTTVDYLVLHYYAGLVNYVERNGVVLVGAQADDQAIFDWLDQPQQVSLPGYVDSTFQLSQLESLSSTYGDARGWQVWQDGFDTLGLPGIDSYLTQVSDTRDRLAPKGRSIPDGYSWGLRVPQSTLQQVAGSSQSITDAAENGAAVWHAANQTNASAGVGTIIKPTGSWLMFTNYDVNIQAMQVAMNGGLQVAVAVTTVVAILLLAPVLAINSLLTVFGVNTGLDGILDDIAQWVAGVISNFSLYSELDSNNPLSSSSTSLSLGDTDEGIVTGNPLTMQTDFTGVVVKGPGKSEWNWTHSRSGNIDDVKSSSAYGEWRFSGAAGATVTPVVPTPVHYNCTISNDKGYCKSHATVSITPEQAVRNLTLKITTVVRYSLRYQSCYGVNFIYDYCEAKSTSGVAPSPGDTTNYNQATSTLYVDVLPNSLDGLWDWSELDNWDADGDFLCNGSHNTPHPSACIGWESTYCPNGVLPTNASSTCTNVWDSDGDGLSDGDEAQLGSNGLLADSDNDGLTDYQELLIGTSPTKSDFDGDGLKDGEEVCYVNASGQQVGGWEVTTLGTGAGFSYWTCSSPTDADYDSDGINDKTERSIGTSPVAANTAPRLTQQVLAPSYEDPSVPGAAALTILGPGDAMQEQFHLFNDIANALDTTLSWCAPSGSFGALTVTGVTASSGYSLPTPSTSTVGSDDCTQWDLSQSPLYPGEEFTVTLQTAALGSAASGTIYQTLTLPFADPADPSVQRQAQATAQVIIDNTPPVAVLNDPPPDDTTITNADSYLVTGSASDLPSDSWVSLVEISAAGGAWQPLNETQVFTWTWTVPTTDGAYTVEARATDVAGNVQTTPASATVVVDRTGPSAAITNLTDGEVITNLTQDGQGGATIPVDIQASDLASGASTVAGVEVIQVSIDGGPWEHIWSARSDAPPTQSTTYSWQVYAGGGGTHSIAARAIDALGQAGNATTVRVVLDILPPTVNLGNYVTDVAAGQTTSLLGHADDIGNAPLPARPIDLSGALDSQDDATVWLEASGVGDLTGATVTWIGDMNGDNRADAAIGMPAYNGGAGKVVILFGRAGDWPVPPNVESLEASTSSLVASGSSGLGQYVAPAGDVNGDGLSDLLVGDAGNNRVYVVFGRYSGTGASWDLSALASSSNSGRGAILTSTGGTVGQWIAAAGDVNDDKYGDLLIGTSSHAYLVAGRSRFSSQTFAIDDGSAAVIAFAASSGAVATGVGDLNDDGLADFAVSDPANSYGGGERVYLFLGSAIYRGAAGIVLTPASDSAASFAGSSQPGKQVVALGDVDGDGVDDLLYSDGNVPRLVYGRSAADWGQGYGGDATLSYSPAASGVLAAPGDVNADGLNDLLLGTSGNQAYVVHGNATRPGSPPIAATISDAAAVASAPYAAGSDLNCDLSSDLLVVPPDAGGSLETAGEIGRGPVPQPDAAGLPVSAPAGRAAAVAGPSQRAAEVADTVYVSATYCAACDNDGHTWATDAFATIQSAINAGGQNIFVLPGIYEEQIALADGVNLVGSGPEVTILAPPAGASSSAASRAPASDLADSSLVGYWPFDGSLADDTGNGNNGTYAGHNGGATYSTDVPAALPGGSSIDFQGGEAIMVKHSDSLLFDQAFTVAYWVQGTAAEMAGKTMGKPGNTGAGEVKWEVQDADGSGNRSRMATYNSPGWDFGPEYDASDVGWRHVAYVVRIQDGLRYQDLYLNGAYVSTVGGNRATSSLGNTTPLWFGSGGDGGFSNPSFTTSGLLDDVALWNTALSADDIAALASGAKSPADWINRPMVSAGMAGDARVAHLTIEGDDLYDGVRVKQGNITLQRLVIRNTNIAVASDGNRAAVTLINNTVVNNVDGVQTRNCGSLDQRNTALAYNQGAAVDLQSCGATDPVAAWSFDEGSGSTAFDDSGNGHDGALTNGAAWTTSAAPIGVENPYALTLDGVDDYVRIPDSDALDFDTDDDFTVSVWIKPGSTQFPTGSNQDSDVVEKWSQHQGRYPFVIRYYNQNAGSNEGKVYVERYDGGHAPKITSSSSINDGQWHQVTFVRSGGDTGTLNLYVDGVLEGSTADTTTGSTVNTSDLYIGQRGDNINRFNGLVDDLQIYDQALSGVAVRSLYNGGRTGGSVTRDYDLFWRNGEDLLVDGTPEDEPAPGDVFADPLFVQSSTNNYQLQTGSPAINAGDPDDPTPPATGGRVDIGAWQHAQAAFYADDSYCETCINDGLDWQVDAFDVVQDAIDTAATTMAQAFGQGTKSTYTVGVGPGTYNESLTLPSYTRLAGSGADDTIVQGPGAGSTVVLSGAIQSEVSGVAITGAGEAAVLVTGYSNNITVTRSLITGNANGIVFEDGSSGATYNNTVAGNSGTAVLASGSGSWAGVHNSILASNATGLSTAGDGAIFNDYNLLYGNTHDYQDDAGTGLVQRSHEITGQDPLFIDPAAGDYRLQASSPAVDSGEPLAPVPVGGGAVSDMGYDEVLAVPLTLLFGVEGTTCLDGSAGMASVEVGISHVIDASEPLTATEPSTWSAAALTTPGETGSYWNAGVTPAEGDGLYRLYAQGDDGAGNDSGPQYVSSFIADGTAPAVTWTWPPQASASTNYPAFELEAEVSDYVPTGSGDRFNVASVSFEVNGAPVDADWVDDGWTEDSGLPRSYRAVVGGVSGTLEVVAVAVDQAGNETRSEARTVTVADNGDSAVITSPSLASNTNNPVLALTGYVRFADPDNNVQVVLTVPGQSINVTASLVDPTAAISAWTAPVTLPGAGVYEIVSTASSGASQHAPEADLEDHVFVNVTYTPPTLVVTSPNDGDLVYDTLDIAGSVTTGSTGLRAMEISLDGGFTWQSLAVAGDGSWSSTWPAPQDQDFAGYEVLFHATDLAGNVASQSRRFFVDNQGPTAFTPVTLDPAPGTHVQVGTTLDVTWQPPTDGSGSAQMLYATSTATDTVPSTTASGTSWSGALDTAGTWYFHLMAEDAAGNQTHTYYGPYYVEGTTTAANSPESSAGGWVQSIIVDGYLDLVNKEWIPETEQLDVDPRWGQPQVLYTTWDSSNLYLGRQGSLWSADGVGWFYLDTGPGGTTKSVHWPALTLPMEADYAIEIISRDDRTLWQFDGAAWQAMPGASFEFDHGASGDTELRVPLAAIGQPDSLSMLAFAANRRTEVIWSVFPTTNPVLTCSPAGPCPDWHDVYHWDSLGQDVVPNQGQPHSHHASITLTSPQGFQTGWGPGETLQFVARVQNLDNDPLTPAGLILDGSAGLAFDAVSPGLEVAPENDRWFVNLGDMAPGDSRTVTLTTHLVPDLTGIEFVTVTGHVVLPLPASEPALANASYSHRVDSHPPVVTIDLPAAALAPGAQTVYGTAQDGDGGGVARVEVQVNGNGWIAAQGTIAWHASIDVPASGSFALSARAIDVHGHTSDPVTMQVQVDSEPPAAILDLADPLLGGAVAHLSGRAADGSGSGVGLVQLQIDGGPWISVTLPFEPAGDGTVIWHYNWTLPHEDGGDHTISVRARDRAGNLGAATEPATVTVDSVAPVSVIASPEPGAVVSPPDLRIWGVATDGYGLDKVEVSLDGARTWQPAELMAAAAVGDALLPRAVVDDGVIWQLTLPVAGGESLIIYSRAADLAGNVQRLGAPVRVTVMAGDMRKIWLPLVNRQN